MKRRSTLWPSFGPGLLWAATAIGVSHLVQSTRAGALSGLGLASVVLLALVLKYPFFEYGPRYAAATGESLIEGYRRIGRWAVWLFLALTLGTAPIVQAVIVLLTSFLLGYACNLSWPLPVIAGLLMSACAVLLAAGRYRSLDLAIKVLIALLTVSTVVTAVAVAPRIEARTLLVWPGTLVSGGLPFAFLLALVGWMPSALDISAWSSLWVLAKRGVDRRAPVEIARLDFNIGYVGSSVLAFGFLVLGAGVMHGSDRTFSPQGTVFATQLVELYTETLGGWSRPLVLVAVVTTMASTALTVMDGFPRVIERTVQNLRPDLVPPLGPGTTGRIYWIALVALFGGTELILLRFPGSLTAMVDFATILSFLTAPVIGWLTLRAVSSPPVPREHRPGRAMRWLSWFGLVLLGGTGIIWLLLG